MQTSTGPVTIFRSVALSHLDTSNTVQLTFLLPAMKYHFKIFIENVQQGIWGGIEHCGAPAPSSVGVIILATIL